MTHFKHIWADLNEMSADLSKPYPTIGSWMQRGIPGKHFTALIEAARLRGELLTVDQIKAFNASVKERRDQGETGRGAA